MKLTRKEEPAKVQYKEKVQEHKKAPPTDWSVYEIDGDGLIPHGKFQGCTVDEIRDEDWYWNWMLDNNLFGAWGLVKLKKGPVKKKYSCFLSERTGEYWVDVKTIDEPCKPAPDWYLNDVI